MSNTRRPNVLLIITDQQSYAAMSCSQAAERRCEVSTPAMDSLAETGVLFSKTYCSYPLCTPSRGGMFTGRMPHEVDIEVNGQPIAERYADQELGTLLQSAAYECVYGGKWHVPESALPDGEHGFHTICGFDDTHLAERCNAYLTEFASGAQETPFFMVASFDNPHNICEWARNQVVPWGPVPDAATEDCPNLPPNFAIPAFEAEGIDWVRQSDNFVHPTASYTDEQWRHYRQAYFGLVEKVDGEIGKILATLRDQGIEEDTLVIFTSDHGDGMAAHHWNQKSIMYEEVARVPLIVSWKGVTAAGVFDDTHLINNGLDILPTICDYCGVEVPSDLRGRSLKPLCRPASEMGPIPTPWRDVVFSESRITPRMDARMVRTERYKYAIYTAGKYREQLYDLENDPLETVNLAVESRYADVLAQHRALLFQECMATADLYMDHYSHPGRPNIPGHSVYDEGGE